MMNKLLYGLLISLVLNVNSFKSKVDQLYIYSYGFHPRIEKYLSITDVIHDKSSVFLLIKDNAFLHEYDSLRKSIKLDTVLIGNLFDPRLVCIRQKGKIRDTIAFSRVAMRLKCNIVTDVDTSLLMLLYPKLPRDHQGGIDEFMPFYRDPNYE